MRGDLARLLYDAINNEVKNNFGDYISSIREYDDRVEVNFTNETPLAGFDMVIGAHEWLSNIRKIVFDEQHDIVKSLGQYTAYFRIPYDTVEWYDATGGRLLLVCLDRQASLSKMYMASMSSIDRLEAALRSNKMEKKLSLREISTDGEWKAP